MKLSNAIRIVLLVVCTVSLSAQQAPSVSAQDQEVFDRIAALTAHLQFSPFAPDQARLYAELGSWTDTVMLQVDNYVQGALNPDEGSQRIQARLRAVLASNSPDPEYGDLPLAQVVDLPLGRVLVVAYTIVRGAHHDLATIRGYQWDVSGFRVAATNAMDFEGYNMFKAILPSPFKTEVWLLAWGQAQAFNGKKVRIRIYSFDGQSFRTVWSPEDVFNADVRTTANGFVVDHELLTPPQYQRIHDEYVLGFSGPFKIK